MYHSFDIKSQKCEFTSGFVIPESAAPIPTEITDWSMPASQGLCVDHVGSYDHLGNAWSTAKQYTRYKKLKQSKFGTCEIYRNNTGHTAPGDLRTEFVLPLR